MSLCCEKLFILHRRHYRNNSLILDTLTEQGERLGIVARGALRSRSPQAGLLSPFIELQVSWSGKGGLKTLQAADAIVTFELSEREKLYCGLYLNEIVMRLVPEQDPHEGLYQAYRDALDGLASDQDPQMLLRIFETQLLSVAGYGLNLETDVEEGQPINAQAWYDYHPESGAHIAAAGFSGGYRISGSALHALAAGVFPTREIRQETKGFMRFILDHYLAGRPLRSRELFSRK